MTRPATNHQARVASAEAGFALLATLAVCIRVEWRHGPDAVVMAVLVPVAMAFSVHGVFNASGLGRLNLIYVPLRLLALVAGLAYSYSHYHAMLPATLSAFGLDIRPLVALVVESLTVSALIAHHGHTLRSPTTDLAKPDPTEVTAAVEPSSLVSVPASEVRAVDSVVPVGVRRRSRLIAAEP